jgi:DNA-binding response OmpR family regulator
MVTKRRVLVVDDEAAIVRFVRTSLVMAGFDVVTAGGGEEAIALAATASPDIMVLDIYMSPVDGYQVLQHVRGRCAMPVIVCSASKSAYEKAREYGATDFIGKPFRPEDLLEKINALLPTGA